MMISGPSALATSPVQFARATASQAEADATQALVARSGVGDAAKGATEIVKESQSNMRSSAASRSADAGPGGLLDIRA